MAEFIASGRNIPYLPDILSKIDHYLIERKSRFKWDRIQNWKAIICLQNKNWQNEVGTCNAWYEYDGLVSWYKENVESYMKSDII